MGCELAQGREWDFAGELDWYLLERPQHQGIARLVADLNRLYRAESTLHDLDFVSEGFEWIDCHDSSQSVLSYVRKDRAGRTLVAAFNFTPVPRPDYRIGVPRPGLYREVLDSDASRYGGSDYGRRGDAESEPVGWMDRPQSLLIDLPPLGGLVLLHEAPALEPAEASLPDDARDANGQ
jgi:1,4-alpha-glucan branching enzyme